MWCKLWDGGTSVYVCILTASHLENNQETEQSSPPCGIFHCCINLQQDRWDTFRSKCRHLSALIINSVTPAGYKVWETTTRQGIILADIVSAPVGPITNSVCGFVKEQAEWRVGQMHVWWTQLEERRMCLFKAQNQSPSPSQTLCSVLMVVLNKTSTQKRKWNESSITQTAHGHKSSNRCSCRCGYRQFHLCIEKLYICLVNGHS